mmetsp:Transcript_48249/g.114816  ORF Transcript_48249/g.114816 Transcript_48249/m.114816 type:complete len:280 (+) Transcript_48249:269-1108(+)
MTDARRGGDVNICGRYFGTGNVPFLSWYSFREITGAGFFSQKISGLVFVLLNSCSRLLLASFRALRSTDTDASSRRACGFPAGGAPPTAPSRSMRDLLCGDASTTASASWRETKDSCRCNPTFSGHWVSQRCSRRSAAWASVLNSTRHTDLIRFSHSHVMVPPLLSRRSRISASVNGRFSFSTLSNFVRLSSGICGTSRWSISAVTPYEVVPRPRTPSALRPAETGASGAGAAPGAPPFRTVRCAFPDGTLTLSEVLLSDPKPCPPREFCAAAPAPGAS